MAINFGAFAGGLSKGFSDTYRMLSEEEERELAMKERRDRMTREAQARTAALETIGRSGQDTYTPELEARGAGTTQAKALEQQNAGFGPEGYAEASRATAGALSREAVPTDMKSRTYKESEAVGDYARRLAAIDPDKALATSTQARQLKQLERSEDLQAKFDAASEKLNKDLALITGTAETGGMKGMAELAKKNGLNVQFVQAANGTGRINVLGKDGKPVQTFTDTASAADALAQARLGQFIQESIPTLGSADKVITALGTQQQMKLAQRADDRAEKKLPYELKTEGAKAGYYESEAAQNRAKVAALAASAEGREAAKTVLQEYDALSPEQQQGPEGYRLLSKAAVAQAAKSGDAASAAKATTYGRALDAHAKAVEQAAKDGVAPPPVTQTLAGFGFAPPEAVRMVETGKKPDGSPLTPAELERIKARYPASFGKQQAQSPAAAANPAPSAIPVAPSKPAAPATTRGTAVAAGNRVPEPPPKEIMRGTNRLPNPAYVEWEKRYGQQYNAQQR